MLSRNSRRTITSRPEVGSSRTSSAGSAARARASATLARIPFDRCLDLAAEAGRLEALDQAADTGPGRPAARPGLGVEAGGEPADLGDGHPVVEARLTRARSRPAGGPPAPAASGRGRASRPARRRGRSGRAGPGSSSSCPPRSRPGGRRPSPSGTSSESPSTADLAPVTLGHPLDPDRRVSWLIACPLRVSCSDAGLPSPTRPTRRGGSPRSPRGRGRSASPRRSPRGAADRTSSPPVVPTPPGGLGRDLEPRPPDRLEQPLGLQLPVRPRHRVRVHHQLLRQLADRGDQLPRPQHARRHRELHLVARSGRKSAGHPTYSNGKAWVHRTTVLSR